MNRFSTILIEGYKSIRELKWLDLNEINVLIGENGSGKSNFISIFDLFPIVISEDQNKLDDYVKAKGGPDAFLWGGPKETTHIHVGMSVGDIYGFGLLVTEDNRLARSSQNRLILSSQHFTSVWDKDQPVPSISELVESSMPQLAECRVFHFHDTSPSARVRRLCAVNDNKSLMRDGGNLAAFLLRLRDGFPNHYYTIRDTVRLVAPFFDDFDLEVDRRSAGQIELEWRERGSDRLQRAHQLSDGTLRFICLATLFLQPTPPPIVVIDEPELGLHPHAIGTLASLIKSTSARAQVIISTQSTVLVDEFEPRDVIVVERRDNRSTFERLSERALSSWLKDYTLGELMNKNVLANRPPS